MRRSGRLLSEQRRGRSAGARAVGITGAGASRIAASLDLAGQLIVAEEGENYTSETLPEQVAAVRERGMTRLTGQECASAWRHKPERTSCSLFPHQEPNRKHCHNDQDHCKSAHKEPLIKYHFQRNLPSGLNRLRKNSITGLFCNRARL